MKEYMHRIGEVELLTPEKEYILATRAAAGDETARAELVESNLRLVVYLAKQYRGLGLDYDDLIQEGNLGLIHAAEKFDPSLNFRFATYASNWIRQAITRAISQKSRSIRIPAHMGEKIAKVLKVEKNLTAEYGRAPTIEEVADFANLTPEEITELKLYNNEIISLDAKVNDEDTTLESFFASDTFKNPEVSAKENETKNAIAAVLDTLPTREAQIIRLRFGLDGTDGKDLLEIGEIMGLSGERVRQLEIKAIQKLRNPVRAGLLEEYY